MTDVPTIRTSHEAVDFLKSQHREIEALFDRVRSSMGSQRQELFTRLRRLLAVHETAEEEIIHPRARHVLHDGDGIVGSRLEEEDLAKQRLADIEDLDVESTQFETGLHSLREAVLAHAAAEELDEFDHLAGALEYEQLHRLQQAGQAAERMAPTRPHPDIGSGGANTLTGPFASMLDRARDALSR